MPRLFTGLEIPGDVGEKLASKRGGLPGARWIDPENYHITLRFIGDVDHSLARDVFSLMDQIDRSRPLPITLESLDGFGGDKPHSVYAKVSLNPALVQLQSEQERLLRRLGLAPETRKFTPHVTLARLRNSSPLDVAHYITTQGLFEKLNFLTSRFVLFSSRDSVGGGPYVVEAAYGLG